MSLSTYLIIMASASAIGWASWLIVLGFIDPFVSGFVGLFAFYMSLFFSLFGTVSLINLSLRALIMRSIPVFRHVGVSLRQAFWLSFIAIMALLLLAHDLFSIWSGVFLFIGIVILEIVFLSRAVQPHHQSSKHI